MRAAAAILALLVAFAVGRVTAPDRPRSAATAPGGVPLGYAHTRTGASQAAMAFTSARMRSVLMDPTRRSEMLRTIGSPEWATSVERSGDLDALSRAGSKVQGLRYLTGSLGVRVTRYTAGRATAVVWSAQTLSGVVFPVASFTTVVVGLHWHGGDWRVTAMRDADAPAVPRVLQPPRRQSTNDVLAGMSPATYGTP